MSHPSGLPELGFSTTWTLRPGLWRSSGLVDQQHHQETEPVTTLERGEVPQVTGADLGEGIVKEIYPSTTSNKSSIPQSSTVTILDARSRDSADAALHRSSPVG